MQYDDKEDKQEEKYDDKEEKHSSKVRTSSQQQYMRYNSNCATTGRASHQLYSCMQMVAA